MTVVILGPSGGVGGTPFDDEPPLEQPRIREVRVWSGACVEAMQLVLDIDGEAVERPRRGQGSESFGVVKLAPGEVITEIYGRYGSYVESLTFRTSRGQVRRFGGQKGAQEFVYLAPEGFHIVGFWGRAGRVLDAIGVHLAAI